MEYKTCNHLHDTGERCGSAAATNRGYCTYHLGCRARALRMAQYRARSERFDLRLPPIESMSAVLSAVNQLVEAVAADMIDLKRADFLLKGLRFAAHALKASDKWQPSVYHTDVAAPAINLEAEYGFPEGLDLAVPPEIAFPPPNPSVMSGALSLSPDFGDRVGLVSPRLAREPLFPNIPPPVVRDYRAEAELAMSETTPEDIELTELYNTEGYKAMERRGREHLRNQDRRRQRKLYRANYERYVAEAKLKNIQRAAEKLLQEKLAAEKAAAEKLDSEKEAAQDSRPDPAIARKPPTPVDDGALETGELVGKEA